MVILRPESALESMYTISVSLGFLILRLGPSGLEIRNMIMLWLMERKSEGEVERERESSGGIIKSLAEWVNSE